MTRVGEKETEYTIYKTGIGKTVATKFMLSHLESDAAEYDDVDFATIWVSCQNLSSSYQVAIALVNEIRGKQDNDRISTTGYSQQRVFDILHEELSSNDSCGFWNRFHHRPCWMIPIVRRITNLCVRSVRRVRISERDIYPLPPLYRHNFLHETISSSITRLI